MEAFLYFAPVNDAMFMQRCLQLAQLGKGQVSPNPMVGAVLVHDGKIIGEGWHHSYGTAHAEVDCLASVPSAVKHLVPGSTMYVSLEPCAHHGKTPPCAERIIHEGIKKVVVCNRDPFDEVNGKGLAKLKAAGVDTTQGVLGSEGRWVNRRFFCFHEQKRPYIILKWAQTIKGVFAPADRSRLQLSNTCSRQLVHKWRAEEDAILVGYYTAKHDDPELTTRFWHGRNPLRVVIDEYNELPAGFRVFNTAAETWVVNAVAEKKKDNTRYIKADFTKSVIEQILEELYAAGKQSLIVEGGAYLLESFINTGLWDEARVIVAGYDLEDGIVAPALNDRDKVQVLDIGNDRLNIYINPGNPYRYINGMEL